GDSVPGLQPGEVVEAERARRDSRHEGGIRGGAAEESAHRQTGESSDGRAERVRRDAARAVPGGTEAEEGTGEEGERRRTREALPRIRGAARPRSEDRRGARERPAEVREDRGVCRD